MATQTLPPRPSYVLLTLAQREARLAVKEQLRARGIKVQHMRASEISATAKLYFVAHSRALLEEAWRKCQRCPDLMRFHEKALKDRAKRIAQNSEHSLNSQSPLAQGLPLLTSHEQNGGAI